MFCPSGPSSVVSVASTSVQMALTLPDKETGAIRISNPTSVPIYVAFGDSSVSASTTDCVVVNSTEVFKIPSPSTHIALISGSATSRPVYITEGQKV